MGEILSQQGKPAQALAKYDTALTKLWTLHKDQGPRHKDQGPPHKDCDIGDMSSGDFAGHCNSAVLRVLMTRPQSRLVEIRFQVQDFHGVALAVEANVLSLTWVPEYDYSTVMDTRADEKTVSDRKYITMKILRDGANAQKA